MTSPQNEKSMALPVTRTPISGYLKVSTANEVSRGEDDRQVAMFLIILRGKNGSGHFIATIHETYSVRGTFRAILYQV